MKQKDAPVAEPNHVLVGTSTYGERKPPTTLPNSSSTGRPFSTRIGAARGGGSSSRTHRSRLRNAASKWMELGTRLLAPSWQAPAGTERPARTMSSGAAE